MDERREKSVGVMNDVKATVRFYFDMRSQTFSPVRRGEVERIEGKLQEQMKRT